MLGLPPSTAGLFVSGGSMANFAALATALRASTDTDVNQRGVAALGRAPIIYAASTVHMSIPKAAAMLGVGRDAIRYLPVDAEFRLDVSALDRALTEDRAADRLPLCVVASAGDVNTGAVDPLDDVADVCNRHNVWFHVDAAYGGFAALAPSVADRFRALARADSIALDPHKWLYAPVDVGCLLARDHAALHRTFSQGAAYVDVIADEHMSDFAFWDYGPELSRRFRALKVWFALKLHGADAIAAAIESNIQVARQLAAAIDASDDFERLAPAPLSIVCFRYAPSGLPDAQLDALNRRLMVEVQRNGDAYLSNAVVNGRFALRACIVNYRTSAGDVEALLSAIRAAARAT
jgi:glutamate/tyrosine decarboxylase-like PLP-dependent enzyme